MKFYRFLLTLAIISIVVLFFYPRITGAEVPNTLQNAPEAPITQQITQYASYYGISPKLALAIAQCESKLNPHAINKEFNASGIYQFLPSSWATYSTMKWGNIKDVFNPSDNIELGVWVLSIEGTSPWLASRNCWGPLLVSH